MKSELEYPFTAAQFNGLSPEERQAIVAVVDYLTGSTINISDEELSEALNLMKPTEGCVPQEEADEDPVAPIRRKFAAVFRTAMELADAELMQKGFKKPEQFNFCLVIDASFEHATQLAIVDADKPVCYLYDWCKAWHFQFETLADLAKEVLAAKANLVNRVTELNKKEVFVVLQEGSVREVVGLPPGKQVIVVDYNIDDVDEQELKPSPLNGEMCKLTRF